MDILSATDSNATLKFRENALIFINIYVLNEYETLGWVWGRENKV